MNTNVTATHFTLRDETREFLNKKIQRIPNAENMLTDLLFNFKKEKQGFTAECTVNFRWGVSIHVSEADPDLNPAIDKMIDKLEIKIVKEKEKVKDHTATRPDQ